MSLRIQTRETGGVTILDCSGQITLGEATSLFRNTIRTLLKNGTSKILLNLGEIRYLDSSGIGELVGAYTSAYTAEAQIKLACLPRKIYDLLQITRLVTVFEVFDDEAEAIRSYR